MNENGKKINQKRTMYHNVGNNKQSVNVVYDMKQLTGHIDTSPSLLSTEAWGSETIETIEKRYLKQ